MQMHSRDLGALVKGNEQHISSCPDSHKLNFAAFKEHSMDLLVNSHLRKLQEYIHRIVAIKANKVNAVSAELGKVCLGGKDGESWYDGYARLSGGDVFAYAKTTILNKEVVNTGMLDGLITKTHQACFFVSCQTP